MSQRLARQRQRRVEGTSVGSLSERQEQNQTIGASGKVSRDSVAKAEESRPMHDGSKLQSQKRTFSLQT